MAKKDAKWKNSVQARQFKALAPKIVPTQPRTVRQSPPEAVTAARAKVLRLEAALSALEDADTVEKENLERVLQRASRGSSHLRTDRHAGIHEQGRAAPLSVEVAGDVSFTVPVTDTETELVRLRAQVAELQGLTIGERPRMRVPVETMPGLVPAELSTWMEDRQRDVQEALSKGDHI